MDGGGGGGGGGMDVAMALEALGLDSDAHPSEDEIRAAFKAQALIWHPDKNAERQEEATVRFQRVDGTLLAFGNLLHRKRTCHVLLFTDMLLVCKPQGGGFFTRVATLPLDEIDVATNAGEDVQWAAEDEDGDGDGGAPAALSKRASSEEEIILAAREDDSRTAAEREATEKRLRAAQGEHKEDHQVILQQGDELRSVQACAHH